MFNWFNSWNDFFRFWLTIAAFVALVYYSPVLLEQTITFIAKIVALFK